jgi:quaternary ammonium compound-resistance protein SugE
MLEVAWAICLKRSDGFRLLGPSVATLALMVVSFWLLALALRELPVGTAYAVWTGIGAVGTALVGMAFLGEPRDAARLVCIALIGAGIVGLKLFS